MPAITEERTQPRRPKARWRRLGWFALLYAGSLAATGLLAYGIRAAMRLALPS